MTRTMCPLCGAFYTDDHHHSLQLPAEPPVIPINPLLFLLLVPELIGNGPEIIQTPNDPDNDFWL